MSLYEEIELLKNIKEKIEDKNTVELKYNSGKIDIALLRKTEADFATAEVQRHIETASTQFSQAIDRNDYETILETNETDCYF
jgi:hypothetical protein